jgi:hypothetical protein
MHIIISTRDSKVAHTHRIHQADCHLATGAGCEQSGLMPTHVYNRHRTAMPLCQRHLVNTIFSFFRGHDTAQLPAVLQQQPCTARLLQCQGCTHRTFRSAAITPK